MQSIAAKLSNKDIAAISSYIQGLHYRCVARQKKHVKRVASAALFLRPPSLQCWNRDRSPVELTGPNPAGAALTSPKE